MNSSFKYILVVLLFLTFFINIGFGQTERYFDEIFAETNKESDIIFGTNFYFVPPVTTDPSNPQQGPLTMDVYTPSGDAETNRPLIIFLHTGNFLPQYLNGSPTGARDDSSVVEICTRFARRGFVSAAISYRLGWNPLYTSADLRRGSLLNAVYRAIHDAQTAVRYFKKSVVENGNPYGIDPNRIVLFGQGSGGYISLAYNSLNSIDELQIEKFVDQSGNPYINTATVGNIDGTGGVVNNYNHPGYSNDIAMVVNLGGALADSSWLDAGEKPIVSFHCPYDGFAPFDQGIVIVPSTGETVVPVSGSKYVIGKANQLGIQNELQTAVFNDPFSLAANQRLASNHPLLNLNPDNYEGLYPFLRPAIAAPFQESAPWEWWDSATVITNVAALNATTGYNLNGLAIHQNNLALHPTMSAEKGRMYIDTIMGFSVPRMIRVLELPGYTFLLYQLGIISYNGPNSGSALNPNPITFATQPAGCPSYSYQWYSFNGITSAPTGSSTNGWTLIPGAIASSYDPPTLFQSTTFACFVTPSAGCGTPGWAQGAASFTITSSAGQVNSAAVQQCGNSPVALSFDSAPNGLGNATYQWYVQSGNVPCPQGNLTAGWQMVSGGNAANASFTPPSNGTYTLACLVTPEANTGLSTQWANGCKVVQISSFTAQSIIGNPNITPFTPYTYLVNQIPGNTYNWQVTGGAISSGQGSNQVSVIWASTGPYLLQLIESNGICSDTTSLNIVSSSCALTVNAVAINPTTFCNGQTASLVANAAGNVTYQWQLNGAVISGASNDTLVADQSGSYQVVATLDANCSAISLPVSLTELPVLSAPSISLSGNSDNCNSEPTTLTASGNFSSFVWSTGASGSSIEVSSSGTYTVTGFDAFNCSAQSAPQEVNLALLPPVNVCVVSVDSLTGRNIVVWEKPQTSLIDSFVIFRESVVAEVYEAIGTQAFADFSTFIDPVANPLVQATRYKLGLIDTCGTLSTTSPFHKTIHLTLNLGVGGTVNLIWSGYEGLNFGSYKIYRGTSPDAMTELVTIQSNLSSYTDLTPPAGTVYYQIGIVVPLCNPTAFGFTQSRSNVANTGSIGLAEISGQTIRVYPNPNNGLITIERPLTESQAFTIHDISGRVCISGLLTGFVSQVSLETLPLGVYLLQVDGRPDWNRKIIRE
jgi:hypothetical protein